MTKVIIVHNGEITKAYSTARKAITAALLGTEFEPYVGMCPKTRESISYPVKDEAAVRKAIAQLNKQGFLTAYEKSYDSPIQITEIQVQ